MQNALIKNLPIETAAKISAANNAHWPNVDEAPPVHHVNYRSRKTSITKISKNTYLIATFSQKNGYQDNSQKNLDDTKGSRVSRLAMLSRQGQWWPLRRTEQ